MLPRSLNFSPGESRNTVFGQQQNQRNRDYFSSPNVTGARYLLVFHGCIPVEIPPSGKGTGNYVSPFHL